MNLRDLEYFVAVADLGQFRAASEKCYVSQPTLSGQIKKLEEELGVPLFERNTRKVFLTSFGKEAIVLAKEVLSKVSKLKEKALAQKDPFQGAIKIGIFPTLGPWLFPKLSQILKDQYPKLEFFLAEEKTENLQNKLINGELDAIILALPQFMANTTIAPLFSEAFFVAVPEDHEWAQREKIDATELEGERLLLLGEGHCFRDQALELCYKYGAGERAQFKATGLETLRQMVRLGTGITLIPRLAVPDHHEPGIRYLQLLNNEARREIGLCFRTTHPRKNFWENAADLIRDYCKTDLPVTPLYL